jgi:hypothetical protein
MLDFVKSTAEQPLVAFRAEFDAAMPERALDSIVGYPLRRTWIELTFLLPALYPGTDCRTPEVARQALEVGSTGGVAAGDAWQSGPFGMARPRRPVTG